VRDRDLVRLYWPVELRPAFDALFDLDDALADVVARSTEPALGAIKLAWWRDRLEELDQQVPAEPRLRAVADELLPRGITGVALGELTDGWTALLEQEPDVERIGEGGAKLFAIAAKLLGASDPLIEPAGRVFRQEQVARRELAAVHWPRDRLHQLAGHRFAKALRPLSAFAALAARDARREDCEPEGTPGRSWALMRHRLTGRI
jgi:15-cis-phytoene synthase